MLDSVRYSFYFGVEETSAATGTPRKDTMQCEFANVNVKLTAVNCLNVDFHREPGQLVYGFEKAYFGQIYAKY